MAFDKLTFNKMNELLGDNKQLGSFIVNISGGKFETPFLMSKTVELLSDQSPYVNLISDANKLSLAKMLKTYFDNCWGIFIEDIKLDNILKFGKMELYKVEAPNGLRYATVNEIAQGVIGLVAENIYPANEVNYKRLSLLQWTFSGSNYYFREAGYSLTYENGAARETLYDMIQLCKNELNELLTWVNTKEYENSLKTIKKMKSKGFKYASYEKDEIEESISIKQLIYNIDKTFPRNSDDMEYRRAIALVIKAKQNFKNLSPLDISFLRRVYVKKALDRTPINKVNEQLKAECETLLNARYSGKIDQNHFAYKIITTLKNKNYESCSDKQYKIISDALSLINKNDKADKKDSTLEKDFGIHGTILDDEDIEKSLGDFSGETLADISDAIGSGLLFEDEEDFV